MLKSKRLRPIDDVVRDATELLYRELGIVDATRFITHLRPGTGDCVAEKHAREDAEDAAAHRAAAAQSPTEVHPAAAG